MEIFFLPKEAVLLEFKRVNGLGLSGVYSQIGQYIKCSSFSYIGKVFK